MLLVPGNSLWFILESSTYPAEKPIAEIYGYRCTITGFVYSEKDSSMALEEEITWICASACRLLIQVPLLPIPIYALFFNNHGALLRKGLNLSHHPTVNEILKRSLPSPSQTSGSAKQFASAVTVVLCLTITGLVLHDLHGKQSKFLYSDLKFVKEFVAGSSSTVAGFLARWMMNEPVVDVNSTQLQMPDEETRLRVATQIKLIPRDQYGRQAQCPNMRTEITVRCGMTSDDSCSSMCYKANQKRNLIAKILKEPYRPTYVNSARYMSISMMPSYQSYCFEELRLACYKDAMMKEQLQAVQQNDGRSVATYINFHFNDCMGSAE
ncbi:unnamed protein product [Gongylonema pulchrum]|uniref:Amiloride-sensitive sodium channel n=1 Tax=Gongylonema pulchrum TaxID=637853 RepID=A0A183D436_9BILA|nr:unnamed protein product [Gongylonema pulchrum]